MNLSDILATRQPALSCEFFPPKTDSGEATLWNAMQELRVMNPAYISVTYGAGGSTQERTQRIVERIRAETELTPVAHLTCVGSTRDDLASLLDSYRASGIENLLALRGDAPVGSDSFQAVAGGFSHATDLVQFIRDQGGFGIAVATYPEGHPESKGGYADDIRYLRLKQENGACAAVTQYFFDNEMFYRFRDAARTAGVTIPLIPGIMAVTNYEQIVRFSGMCGARIPDWLHARMAPLKDSAEGQLAAGIEIATTQCRDLLANGVAGLHFYTLNRSGPTLAICREL